MKYYHPTIASSSALNWDVPLIRKIPGVCEAENDEKFNDLLMDMMDVLNTPEIPDSPPPEYVDSLAFGLDLAWLNDEILREDVKERLETIYERFRPIPHRLAFQPSAGTSVPGFFLEAEYPNQNFNSYEYRLLGLFRYWNIIKYFYPYIQLMDQPWDETLKEFIPIFVNAETPLSLHLAVQTLFAHLNDSHGMTWSAELSKHFGSFYPGFSTRIINEKSVVQYVSPSLTNVYPGDIILQVGGVDVGDLYDSLVPLIAASTNSSMNFRFSYLMLRGKEGPVQITLENKDGIRNEIVDRTSIYPYQYYHNLSIPMLRDTIISDHLTTIINMGRLTVDDIPPMGGGFWNSDYIIFDCRNYPNGVLWELVNYLYKDPIQIAKFIYPNCHFPGTYISRIEEIGQGASQVYEGNIIILIDEGSLSQCEYTIMGLEQFPGALKIGQSTQGADGNANNIYGFGSVRSMFTGLGVVYPDGRQTQRIGIEPDISVYPTLKAVAQGRDEILEAAFREISGISGTGSVVWRKGEFNIYPNPVTNLLNVNFVGSEPLVSIEIFGLDGKNMFTNKTGKRTLLIDFSSFPAGIYSVVTTTTKVKSSFKVVKY